MPNVSQFYFAWVDSGETAFGVEHQREDELIFAFELAHEEGQFAELEIEIANPYVGLLAPGRPLWAWFAWDDGADIYPLFFGRLIGIPDDLFANVIKLKLLAKPLDYAAQRTALAETLRVLPFYDPIFIDEAKSLDPDVALEGYSALWHVDRTTHEVTISDIIAGEDGIIEFTQNDVFYDSVKMQLSGAPLLAVEITAESEWTQCDGTGVFEMKAVEGMEGNPEVGGGVKIKDGVKDPFGFGKTSKPKEPTQTTYSWEYKNVTPGPHEDGDLMEEKGSITIPYYGGELTSQDKSVQYADPETGTGEEYSIKESYKDTQQVPPPEDPEDDKQPDSGGGGGKDEKKGKAEVATAVEQDRKEGIYVAVRADVQPVLAELAEDESDLFESLTMNSRDVVEAGAATSSNGAYFSTARGQQSVEYLLMVARAHLLAGSRVVEVAWECSFPKAIYVGLSCRKNAIIEDPRLPGNIVLGKIVSYELSGDGDDGEFIAAITMNSAVGNGNAVMLASGQAATVGSRAVAVAGTPVYVAEGYVDPGYQHYEGRFISAVTGDLTFEGLAYEAVGLQLPITEDQIVLRHEYHSPIQTAGMAGAEGSGGMAGFGTSGAASLLSTGAGQLNSFKMPPIGEMIKDPPGAALQYAQMDIQLNEALMQYEEDNPSWVEMEFRPVQKIATQVNYEANVTPLMVPKQIDLAAG